MALGVQHSSAIQVGLQASRYAIRLDSLAFELTMLDVQKGVMISHKNVISNTLQITAYDKPGREETMKKANIADSQETTLGLLPMSHIYSLVVICHANTYRGDRVVVLPKFDFQAYCGAIQRFQINTLYLVSKRSNEWPMCTYLQC